MKNNTDQDLIDAARDARENAYAPYSNFKVGAAVEADDGQIYIGCNVESASYGLTVCAERVAIWKGISRGEKHFKRIAVVVDTEEEYDWNAPFNRDSIGVGHMRQIGRVQAICERWGIRPVYVIDYPIASQAPGIEALRPLLQSGTALVGAHLHPWVSPPHEEEVNERNSFPGNLPPALERALRYPFSRSVLSEGHEAISRPSAHPASISVQGAWQIAATGLPASKNAFAKPTARSSSRRWSGFITPPGSTSAS